MLAYKAFRSGLVCLGFQFAMGLNETEKANCAQNGFHCAANPLDCLTYYPDMEKSEYYLVDAGGCTGTTYLRNAGKGGTGGGKCGKGPILGGFAAGRPRNRGGMSQLF